MAMNKQRKTSNLLNILSYDDAGNIVLRDYSQTIRYNWNGTIHAFTGPLSISSVAAAVTDTDRFLVSDGGVLKYRTGAEVLSDIGAIGGSGATGQVAYWNGTSSQTGSNNLFWDAANSRLGIGTNTPVGKLHLRVGTDANVIFTGEFQYSINNAGNAFTNYTLSTLQTVFSTNGAERMRITSSTGNILLGTTTDSGQRLQVQGDAFISGNLGIGISPLSRLHISGAGDQSIILQSTSTGTTTSSYIKYIRATTGSARTWWTGVGIQGGGDDSYSFYDQTAGAERMRLTSGGNLLVGTTTNAGQKLQVAGTTISTATNIPFQSVVTSSEMYNSFFVNTSTLIGYIGNGDGIITNGGTNNFGIRAEADLIFAAGGNNRRMTITSGGNLLVGTTADQGYRVQITSASADGQLNVWGATAPSIRLDNAASGATQRFVIGLATATNNFIQGANAGDVCMTPGTSSALVFGMWQTSSSSEVMRISTSSNVLIGTSTDVGAKLRVVGDISASVDLRLTRTGTSPAIILDQTQLRLVNQTSGFTIGLNVENDIIRFGGAIRTTPPAGSGNPEYKLGSYSATAPTATGYLNIEVGGVVYKVLAST